MNKGRVGEERKGKEMDGCPLTVATDDMAVATDNMAVAGTPRNAIDAFKKKNRSVM
jgi:hypothetical protein